MVKAEIVVLKKNVVIKPVLAVSNARNVKFVDLNAK